MNGWVKEVERIVRKVVWWNNVSYEEVIVKVLLKVVEIKILLYNGVDKMVGIWGGIKGRWVRLWN